MPIKSVKSIKIVSQSSQTPSPETDKQGWAQTQKSPLPSTPTIQPATVQARVVPKYVPPAAQNKPFSPMVFDQTNNIWKTSL